MPYPATFHGHPIASCYGRAFWLGFHHYLGTPEWFPIIAARQRRSNGLCIYSSKKHLHAFWEGGDFAQTAMLAQLAKPHRQIANEALKGSR